MPVDEFQFASTNIDVASYDTETRQLDVTFVRTGETYPFYDVPAGIWEDFKRSLSPGRFFANEIKGRYG